MRLWESEMRNIILFNINIIILIEIKISSQLYKDLNNTFNKYTIYRYITRYRYWIKKNQHKSVPT